MASGIFAVLDDIAALMDDVAVASKVAAQKTAGILGDDLAVNAEKATGFISSREIPVLWAITKGSFINKLIIVPIALVLNAFFPTAIKYVLIAGAFYLAFEGIEKIFHYFFHKSNEPGKEIKEIETNHDEHAEKAKVKSAIITDFILSIEIVIIALSTVLNEPLALQIITVSVVAILATVGVYGFVALIVRMDDAGYKLIGLTKKKGLISALGQILVNALPIIIKMLAVIGTIALILVAGGIFIHNIEYIHDLFPDFPIIIREALFGIIVGLVIFPIVIAGKKIGSLIKKK